MLEAPSIQDDFYLNLIDWGSQVRCALACPGLLWRRAVKLAFQNVLSVGLGSSVYLWNAQTSQVTKLTEFPSNDLVTSVSWMERGGHIALGSNSGAFVCVVSAISSPFHAADCRPLRGLGRNGRQRGALHGSPQGQKPSPEREREDVSRNHRPLSIRIALARCAGTATFSRRARVTASSTTTTCARPNRTWPSWPATSRRYAVCGAFCFALMLVCTCVTSECVRAVGVTTASSWPAEATTTSCSSGARSPQCPCRSSAITPRLSRPLVSVSAELWLVECTS